MRFAFVRRLLSTARARLLLLVSAVLLPLGIFTIVLFFQYSESERERYRAEALATAQAVNNAIDRELVALSASLEALAASVALDPNSDLSAFRREAFAVLRKRGYAIILRDQKGRQIFSTLTGRLGGGGVTDPDLLETDRVVFASGQPAVSDLFRTSDTGQSLVMVDAPVFDDGTVAYVLGIAVEPVALSVILRDAARPGWTVSIVDRHDRVVASSRPDPSFVGAVATADLRRASKGTVGSWYGTTLEGRKVLGTYVRSSFSGWRIAVGVPLDTISRPVVRLTVLTLASGSVVASLALGLALMVARTISRPIAHLAYAADRLGHGEIVPPVETDLVEIREAGMAMAAAQQAIAARQAALLASEERFRAAVRAVEGWVWTIDAKGRMTGEQAGWAALTGQTPQEYQGRGWLDAVHPEDAAETARVLTQAVLERRSFEFEHRIRRSDKVYRRFAVRAIVSSEVGEAVQWVGVHTDITEDHAYKKRLAAQEAKQRELNVTLAERVERASRDRDRVWRVSTELMVVLDLTGVVVAANPAWAVTLGWQENDLIGRSMFDLLHPDDVASTVQELDRLPAAGNRLGIENRLRHQDGRYRWLCWTVVLEAGLLHGVGRDETSIKEAAAALQQTEEQLRQSQKMEIVGQLTGGVAHDFNNLLTVVSGHIEMAQRRLDDGAGREKLRRNLEAAREGARRAAVLTHRLLAFSRRMPLHPELIDLNEIVQGMTDLIRRTLGETITVTTSLTQPLHPVEADVNQIENAMLNLCVNARDAMPQGGLLEIRTENRAFDMDDELVRRGDLSPGPYAVVVITDTGVGIPEDIRPRIFEPFFTTKPVGKGTGLGLSQVFGLMRQLNGTVAVTSCVGAGTTVELYFPRAKGGPGVQDASS